MLLFAPREFPEIGLLETAEARINREGWLAKWAKECCPDAAKADWESLLWNPVSESLEELLNTRAKMVSLHYGLKSQFGKSPVDTIGADMLPQGEAYWAVARAYLGSDDATRKYFQFLREWLGTSEKLCRELDGEYGSYRRTFKELSWATFKILRAVMSTQAEAWIYNTAKFLGWDEPLEFRKSTYEETPNQVESIIRYALWLDYIGAFSTTLWKDLKAAERLSADPLNSLSDLPAENLARFWMDEDPDLRVLAKQHSWPLHKLFGRCHRRFT